MANQVVVEFLGNARALNTVIGRVDGRFGALGKSVTRGFQAAGIAVAATATQAVRSFVAFDEAMTNSTAIMGDLSDTMRNDLADAAIEVGKTTRFSATEAGESLFFLTSAGLSAEESLAALPKVAAFAQAGNFDMALATDLLTDAQSALGLEFDSTAERIEHMVLLGDTFVEMNKSANGSVEQFSKAMTNGGAASLKRFNIPLAEGGALLNVWADQGIKGEKAGTAMRRTLTDLTRQADKNKEAFAELGINVFDSSGAVNSMADIVGDMEEAFAGLSVETQEASLRSLGFTEDSSKAIIPLLGNAQALRDYEAAIGDASGATDEVAQLQLGSLAAQWDLVKGSIEAVSLTATGELKPQMLGAIESIRGFVESNGPGISEGLSAGIAGFISFLEANGPAIFAFLQKAFQGFSAVMRAVFTGIGAIWSSVGRPLFNRISSLAVQLFDGLQKWWDSDGQELFDQIRTMIFIVLEFLRGWWDRHGAAIIGVVSQFGAVFKELFAALKDAWDSYLKDIFLGLATVVGVLVEGFGRFIGVIDKYNVISTIMSVAITVVSTVLKILVEAGKVAVRGILGFIDVLIQLGRWLGEAIQWVVRLAGGIGTKFGEAKDFISRFYGDVLLGWGALTGGFSSGLESVKEFFSNAWTSIKNKFTDLKDDISRIWNQIKGFFAGVGRFGGNIFDGISNGFRNVINAVIGVWNGLRFDIPEVGIPGLGTIGGGTVGVTQITPLATGGVVAPNDPFLALLGDNTREREIVSPESLMREVVRTEIQGTAPGSQGGSGVSISIDTLNQVGTVDELAEEIMWHARRGVV